MSVRAYPFGTEYPPKALDATLQALADLNTSANTAPYFSDIDQAALMTVSPLARSLLDDTTTAEMRATLEIPEGGGTPTGLPNTVAVFGALGTLTADTDFIYDAATNRLGIGITPEYPLDIYQTLSANASSPDMHGQRIQHIVTYTAGRNLSSYALQLRQVSNMATFQNASGAAGGLQVFVESSDTGSLSIQGISVNPYITQTAINTYVGLNLATLTLFSGATCASSTHILLGNPSAATDAYGIRSTMTSGANRWGLHFTGTVKHWLVGNLGLGSGKGTPAESLDTAGGIRLGAAAATNDGTIQYASGDFQGRKAGAWVSLTGGGLGTLAQQNANAVAITGGSATGLTTVGTQVLALPDAVAPVANFRMSVRWLHAAPGGLVFLVTDSDTGAFPPISFLNMAGATIGSISQTASAVAFNTTSDARLKHAITPLTGALGVVQALKPISHLWRADDSRGYGFLAHEVQETISDGGIVTGEWGGVDEEGRIVPQQMDLSKLMPWVVAGMQEMLTRLERLEARA